MTKIAAIVLAAGQASRYRAQDASLASKVLARLEGKPLVLHVCEAAIASGARPVILVTGAARREVETAVEGLDVVLAHNDAFADGMAGSLRTGLAGVPEDARAAVILLADMPRVGAGFVGQLIAAFEANPHADAIVPIYDGKRGNPVLLARSLFACVSALAGDEGARRILADPALHVIEIEGEATVRLDIDTPQALEAAAKRAH